MPETGQTNLEAMERLSPAQSGGDQDELLQAAGRAGDGQDVRASGGGTAHSCGAAQPLQPAGPSCDGGRGVNASGVWGMASQIWFMQKRHLYKQVLEIDLPWLNEVVQAKTPKRLPVVL